MIAWAGAFSLALGFCAALVSAAAWGRAGVRGGSSGVGRVATVVALLGCLLSVLMLETALVNHDFSVRFVAENGSRATPLFYTVTSLWAAHDGSLLLWTLVLSVYLVVLARRPRPAEGGLHAWAVAVTAAVTAFFAGLELLTGGVFDQVSPVPTDGPGPTPLLQANPAMGVHPPLLYAGLVGAVVPFAYAVAGLVTGEVGRRWIAAVTPWARVAWTALTAGIVLGAWWSYAVLGWGGYWGWDPVENSSLMPWLLLTALIHSAMVQRRTGALPVWNLSLALGGFLLAALGVLLTRSGLVSSVHSFADSGVGPVLLGFVAALAVAVVALVLLRTGRLGAPRPLGPLVSRAGALLLNNVLLVVLTVTVLLGTILPVLVESATGDRVGVGPPYYDRMAVPLVTGLLLMMAVGPLLPWRGGGAERALGLLLLPGLLACATAVWLRLDAGGPVAADLAVGLAVLVAAGVVTTTAEEVRVVLRGTPARRGRVLDWARRNRPRLAGRVVHVGFAVLAVGVAVSSAFTTVTERSLGPGQTVSLSGVRVALAGIDRQRSDREMRTAVRLEVRRGDSTTALEPALRFFVARKDTVASPAIDSGLFGDVYATLLSVDQAGQQATVRLAVNPLVGWIWAGGALMVLGSLIGLGRRRRRASVTDDQAPPRRAEVVGA